MFKKRKKPPYPCPSCAKPGVGHGLKEPRLVACALADCGWKTCPICLISWDDDGHAIPVNRYLLQG
jgi:hypothetical protein